MDVLKLRIQKATELIDNSRYKEAERLLAETVGSYITSPEIYNLFGILEEYQGDYAKAAKFYRASYAFDPSFKPAASNLERVTSFVPNLSKAATQASAGEDDEEYFYIEYDEAKIGHIKKKSGNLE